MSINPGNENRSRATVNQKTREASNGITKNSRHQECQTLSRNQNSSSQCNSPSTSNPNGRSQRSNNVKKQEDRWLCNHYKRRCMVKFECCDKYWPCHRCHNETSTCQQKKLKSRDTTMVKCMECGKEQEVRKICNIMNTYFIWLIEALV